MIVIRSHSPANFLQVALCPRLSISVHCLRAEKIHKLWRGRLEQRADLGYYELILDWHVVHVEFV
jgi:hypothetical protein